MEFLGKRGKGTTVMRAAMINIVLVGAFFLGVVSAYVGVQMHAGTEFDMGSFVQWAALGEMAVAVTGILAVCFQERG